MTYSISHELYHEVAARLSDAIDSKNYFSGSLTFVFDGVECRLTTSIIVYRERVSMPEGDCDAISDLVPVWWEFHTVTDEGECLNDFDFGEMKGYI